MTKNDQTIEIVDNLFLNEILEVSNEVHVLTKKADSLFAVIVDENLVTESILLTTSSVSGPLYRNVTKNTIFLRDNIHYNADLKAIDSIPVDENSFIFKVLNSSGNSVIYYQWLNSQAQYFLVNTNTEMVTPLGLSYSQSEKI